MNQLLASNTWNDAAAAASEIIFGQIRPVKRASLERLRLDYDVFIDEFFHSTSGFVKATAKWAAIGADSLEWGMEHGFKINEDTLVKTLIRKQRDYGPENIRRFGRQGLMVRMHDKIARLENLVTNEKNPNNESIDDTVMDIAGYSAIGIMWENQKFLLPLV
ncbi:MAG: hypothetical protein ACK5S6_00505 [bacterium]|jgi:hypothetical protein